MRTRIIVTLAATAVALTSCGLNSPTGFEGKAGSATASAFAEATFLDAVHEEVPDLVLELMSDYDAIEFGEGICERLGDGDTPADIEEIYVDELADAETQEDLDIVEGVATVAELAMKHLCPELS